MIMKWIFRGTICIILVLILTLGTYDLLQMIMITFAMVSLDVTVENNMLGGKGNEDS